MVSLTESESIKYSGGGKFTRGIAVFFAAFGAFVLGIIDGLANPKVCNR